ncbi:MOSC domain-containing protein [Nonomuraea rhodomycinica]|uniref:MOSC domain-containing protein n=1 Tax=Nonomuraea rhodomycinica TaxID=1712872 RepID=A0A7Y6MDB7_9ACTN|nr:MOSC N-terminal beta barrel domain-containing protein [Nonomuraea rhodomycinica]NUW44298.1 MOSC domain-containing protein [Nonomuraea rhodomycinica]
MRLASIHFYPVKSTSGHEVRRAEVEPWGLAGDRRFVVVGGDGKLLTARTHARLLACVAELDGDPAAGGALTLTGPHEAPLRVVPREPRRITVAYPREVLDLADCGDEAAAWLSGLLGEPARLAWQDDPRGRAVDPLYSRPEDRVSLADAYPLLLTTTASLDRLNAWVAETAAERGEEPRPPLSMRRFRPNVVIDGVAEPFDEDTWKRVRIGEVGFRVSKGCDRCVLPTIDPVTLAKGKEPTRTLARHRKWDGKVWFGVNLIPDGPGVLTQGDPVTVL